MRNPITEEIRFIFRHETGVTHCLMIPNDQIKENTSLLAHLLIQGLRVARLPTAEQFILCTNITVSESVWLDCVSNDLHNINENKASFLG